MNSTVRQSEQHREPIAVIGLGCWYPGARNPGQLWENILSRRLEFRSIPDERLPLQDYCDVTGESPDKIYSQRAAVIDGFEFDWVGRRIPKSMFEATDLVHWLSVEVAEQAIHDAGYSKESLDKDGTGVIVGNTLTGDITRAETVRLRWPLVRRALRATCSAHGLASDDTEKLEASLEKTFKSVFNEPNPDTLAGGLANTIAGRVCNYFDLHGGGFIVDGACSSSLLAVCTAARALSAGDLNAALVGGVDISIDPFELVGFSRAGALSKGDMNVYDKSAAGFIPGEGCGFVMLKRLADARRDGDQVYATLRGWGISSDGKGGIMTPTSGGQALAIRRAYSTAGYSPADLDFVEGHGTGTSVGDATELRGVYEAQTHADNPASVAPRRTGMTSLKSIIGHTKAAAGIGAFIKAVVAVNRRVLPPTGSCRQPNPVFDASCHSLYPLMHGATVDPAETLRAGVSAMGFGGINSHVTLESADAPNDKLAPIIAEPALMAADQTSEIFMFAAKTVESVKGHVRELLQTARQLSFAELVDLSAELANRVVNSAPIRAALVAASPTELEAKLKTLLELLGQPPLHGNTISSSKGDVWLSNACDQSRVGFLFPGQGSQQVGAARKLAARFDWAREMVEAADRVQVAAGLPTVTETVYVGLQQTIGNEQHAARQATLARTEIAQVAIVTASAIYARFLETLGIRPVVCGGHSLGELTALYQAGAYDFETMLKLAAVRGQAMAASANAASGSMAALLCSEATARKLIDEACGYAVVANVNSPSQLVISGDRETIDEVVRLAKARNISAVPLKVSNAFHSEYVRDAAETLYQQSPVSSPHRLDIDVFSCVDGQALDETVDLRNHLAKQVTARVDFVSLLHGVESQCDLLIEVGPGSVLTNLANESLQSSAVACSAIASRADVDCCLNRLLAKAFAHGVDVAWDRLFDNRLHRPFVPVGERVFIKNPCEGEFDDLGDVEPLSASSPNPTSSFKPVPFELVTINDHVPSNTAMIQNEDQFPSAESKPADDGIEAVILEIIEDRTGFPIDTLTTDLRLLDDLNLDSIKAGDIVATAARQLEIEGEVDPANLGDATIADVVDAIRAAKGGAPPTAPAPAMPTPAASLAPVAAVAASSVTSPSKSGAQPAAMASVAPSLQPTTPMASSAPTVAPKSPTPVLPPDWVRNFSIEFAEQALVGEQRDIAGRHFRVLYDASHQYFIELLHRRFGERNATASFERYDQPGQIEGQMRPDGTTVHVVALLPREIPAATSQQKLHRMVQRLHRAVAGVAAHAAAGVAFVEFGNGRFGAEGITDVERSGTAAFARALHLESPSLEVRVVDFADELSDFLATDFITNEIACAASFCDAAYDRLGRRFETRHRLRQPAGDPRSPLPLNGQDVILVTGGARGITAECAIALAEKTGARMALVGSSTHPRETDGTSAAAAEIAATLKRYQALTATCEYFSCDLTDAHAVRQLIASVESKLGAITGLIHGAGRNAPGPARAATMEQALAEVSPKVLGVTNLLESLSNRPLRCLVGLTSIIGVTGIPGNTWYAFSNETLDLILRQYRTRHPEALVRSISYSAWSGVGMGAKGQVEANLQRMGVGMIPLREGVGRFMHALEHELDDIQLLVTGSLGGIDTWRPVGIDKCSRSARFIDDVRQFEPGISLTTRVRLDHASDPYLQDHIYSGTCLFPAVMGMEAMAQAAAYLVMPMAGMDDSDGMGGRADMADVTSPTVIRIQNVDLPRPIIVGDEGEVLLELHAEARETNEAGETVVAVGIRTERTQFQQDHFAAEIVFGNLPVGACQPEQTGEPLDIDPQRDLYNGIMFQGPRFQRWGNSFHLERGRMLLDVLHSEASCQGADVFGERVDERNGVAPLKTGDPFYRDVLLQSIQALIPQRIGLPLSIGKIEFFAPSNAATAGGEPADRRLVLSKMNVIGDKVGEEHICEVVVKDPTGDVREHMTGYRVKVLAVNEDYPTAAELADLAAYDQQSFLAQAGAALSVAGVKNPTIYLRRMPELHGMDRESRHIAERPMMEATVARHVSGKESGLPTIEWLESGRPIVAENVCEISLSHDEDYCLCIANDDAAGCDLAPVTARSRDQWVALIGNSNASLLDTLMSQGDCLDKAGTRIWSAVEAAQKSIDQAISIPLAVKASQDSCVVLTAAALGDTLVVVTFPVRLHRSPLRMAAIVAPKATLTETKPETPSSSFAPSRPLSERAPQPPQRMAQSMAQPMAGGFAPSQPRNGGGNGAPNGGRTYVEMLAMAKMATTAMSPDEANSDGGAMAMAARPETLSASTMASMTPMAPTQGAAPAAVVDSVESLGEDGRELRATNLAPPDVIRVIDDISAIHKWDGPQDQAVFEYKFPVTFKECAKKGKHVQQSQFIDWMGLLRENALLYLCPEMAHKLSDGFSGMATNWTDIDVVGELMMGDMVIARFFREEMTEATINLVCEFCRLMPDGRLLQVAVVRQAATWVALEGKSDPVKAAFPKFLADALRKVAPRTDAAPRYDERMNTLGRLKLEQQRLEAASPHAPVVLWAEEFQTTSADSNIVQNLYHSRYFNWQWRTTDLYLYSVVPQLVASITAIGNVRELVPLNGHIDYVRDAFPFDRICTELAVTRSTECAASLQFTHSRVLESGELQKLSVGKQDVVWVRRTPAATPTPEPFPRAVREALQAAADSKQDNSHASIN